MAQSRDFTRLFRRGAAAFTIGCIVAGCWRRGGGERVQSRYLADRNTDTVVVFFHGIFGDPSGTWTAPKTDSSVAAFIAADTAIGQPDVFLVGYDSPLFTETLNIEENAAKVLSDLKDRGVFRRHSIVFVTHSEGGLVARRIVQKVRSDTLLGRIKGVVLMGVPVHGADVAGWTYWASWNPQLKDMRPEGANTLLQSWEADWQSLFRDRDGARAAGKPFQVPMAFCAYENLPMGPVKIVPALYASTRCDNEPYPLPYNHAEIVKPGKRDDDRYRWISARIQQSLNGGPTFVQANSPRMTRFSVIRLRDGEAGERVNDACLGNPALPDHSSCVAFLQGTAAAQRLVYDVPDSVKPSAIEGAVLELSGLASREGSLPRCVAGSVDGNTSSRAKLTIGRFTGDGSLRLEAALSTVSIPLAGLGRDAVRPGSHSVAISIPADCGGSDGFLAFRSATLNFRWAP